MMADLKDVLHHSVGTLLHESTIAEQCGRKTCSQLLYIHSRCDVSYEDWLAQQLYSLATSLYHKTNIHNSLLLYTFQSHAESELLNLLVVSTIAAEDKIQLFIELKKLYMLAMPAELYGRFIHRFFEICRGILEGDESYLYSYALDFMLYMFLCESNYGHDRYKPIITKLLIWFLFNSSQNNEPRIAEYILQCSILYPQNSSDRNIMKVIFSTFFQSNLVQCKENESTLLMYTNDLSRIFDYITGWRFTNIINGYETLIMKFYMNIIHNQCNAYTVIRKQIICLLSPVKTITAVVTSDIYFDFLTTVLYHCPPAEDYTSLFYIKFLRIASEYNVFTKYWIYHVSGIYMIRNIWDGLYRTSNSHLGYNALGLLDSLWSAYPSEVESFFSFRAHDFIRRLFIHLKNPCYEKTSVINILRLILEKCSPNFALAFMDHSFSEKFKMYVAYQCEVNLALVKTTAALHRNYMYKIVLNAVRPNINPILFLGMHDCFSIIRKYDRVLHSLSYSDPCQHSASTIEIDNEMDSEN